MYFAISNLLTEKRGELQGYLVLSIFGSDKEKEKENEEQNIFVSKLLSLQRKITDTMGTQKKIIASFFILLLQYQASQLSSPFCMV